MQNPLTDATESQSALLDRYLSSSIRAHIEQEYYERVSQQAELDVAAANVEFVNNPLQHVTLYSDHGPIHARNVATNILDVLSAVNGVLIPRREPVRLEFMKGYGVLIAYCHDIGMKDFSAFGRKMHPEFAAQEVFGQGWDWVVKLIWEENWANVAWRLLNLTQLGVLDEEPQVVLRELLSLSMAHSKSKVGIRTLNDPSALQTLMRHTLNTGLKQLYDSQQLHKADDSRLSPSGTILKNEINDRTGGPAPQRLYANFASNAFSWLTSKNDELAELTSDVVDTLRALRVADALRQRGTTLKTSASYPILVDHDTGNAVFALQRNTGDTFLLESPVVISAGEANIASTEVTYEGDLRVSFHRGAFASRRAAAQSARNVAEIVDDIQRDVIASFLRSPDQHLGLKESGAIKILVEATDDNIEFADLVLAELQNIDASLTDRSRVVPSLKNVDADERQRYLSSELIAWSVDKQKDVLRRVAEAGHRTEAIEASKAFVDVRLSNLREGDILLSAGSPPGFVYLPLGEGLRATPLGGYRSFAARPWIPLGNIRAIRHASQETTVVADQEVKVLIIPREVYLKCWHHTYSEAEFRDLLPGLAAANARVGAEEILDVLCQLSMLDANLDQRELEFIAAFARSHGLVLGLEELRKRLETGGRTDIMRLRDSVIGYLALSPGRVQIGRLRDLLNALIKLDAQVSKEEALVATELNNLLREALGDIESSSQFTVVIAPQNQEQDLAISSLFPLFVRRETSGGTAFAAGTYHSLDYADVACKRYRDLHFFTVVVKET